MRLLPAILLALSPVAHAQDAAPPTASLVLTIQGLKSTEGQVLVAVFDQPDGYPGESEKAAFRKIATPVAPNTTVTFDGLPFGTYAVVAFHDENGNDVLDVGSFIPIPKEPLGASRDARRPFGPPRFEDAQFVVAEATHRETFTLVRY